MFKSTSPHPRHGSPTLLVLRVGEANGGGVCRLPRQLVGPLPSPEVVVQVDAHGHVCESNGVLRLGGHHGFDLLLRQRRGRPREMESEMNA